MYVLILSLCPWDHSVLSVSSLSIVYSVDCKTVGIFCKGKRPSVFERKVLSECKNGEVD